ncbi:MAG: beta-ketoacyl-[acyl-carrier-protein] synthase family protein [Bdellovibrionaceae bacterium]|nr:beta-ketoacyl-[acyl-carrier-protein] synthase family protein [Pseudobdellovibrionaceae bacterium]
MKIYVSGYGAITSLGNTPNEIFGSLLENRSAVRKITDWDKINGLNCRLGAPAMPYVSSGLPRTARRTMSPMSEMAALATEQALGHAKLDLKDLDFSRSLLSMGSTTGSPIGLEDYFQKIQNNNGVQNQSGTAFFKIMNHSVASNVAVALGFNGALISPSSACATSAQAAIIGWELIKSGLYDIAICGGADEMHYLSAAVFDSVYAASRGFHDDPKATPRPFDKRRDGLVVSEGASVVILENEASLSRRGSKALGEFCGGAYLCESSHMSQSNELQMHTVMSLALERSGLKKENIEYVSAHATGTLQGDAAEAAAIGGLFGGQVPVSSLKAHFGHSMAACGTQELITTLMMMNEGVQIGTRNLEEVAPECSQVMHLKQNRKISTDIALSNNFAFGGINTSFVIRKVEQ